MSIGSHYTPSELAREVIQRTVDPLIEVYGEGKILSLRVCDPSCGDGVFLIETCLYLAERIGESLATVAQKCIYGVEIDLDAAIQARAKLSEFSGCPESYLNIYYADFLKVDLPQMDAFVGNPPFLGGSKISGQLGADYRRWLKQRWPHSHGNADYCSFFFLRAVELLRDGNGTVGLIATNTIAQGDTRNTGLKWLVNHGCHLYDSVKSRPWPGAAAVTVAIVHLAKGNPVKQIKGQIFNSRLGTKPERPDPVRLAANANRSFQGSIVLGMGFTLTSEEREALITRNPKNAEQIFPYIGGEEVNTSPTQDFHRYVINFGQMSLEEAENWPDLIKIVREKVKPERDKLKNNPDGRRRKKYWWQFGRSTPALEKSIQDLPRCLVTLFTTKHLTFSFQPTDRIFANSLWVFPFSNYAPFVILQSRIHEFWTRLLSSSLEDRLRYAATDCFETFPFPDDQLLKPTSQLEKIGRKLYQARARFMVDTDQGLTQTYNLLKDPNCADPRIIDLRQQHWEMDRVVLAAYGWDDLAVPPYGTPTSDVETRALSDFRDEVIDRLFVLNAERAEFELKQLKLGENFG